MNGRFLAIDKGKHGCGCAIFNGNALAAATYVTRYASVPLHGPGLWAATAAATYDWFNERLVLSGVTLLLEVDRIYPGSDKTPNPTDLLDLAGVNGALAYAFSRHDVYTRSYYPSEWKGQVLKKTMTARILEKLTIEERANIQSVGSKDHNTIDAIGIGLFHVGRLHKKVIHR